MTTSKQTTTQTTTREGYALEDLDIAPGVLGVLAEMEAARQDSRSLGPEDRAAYVAAICKSLRLNPLTRPVQFLALQGREVLYLTRGATDQLAARHNLNRETLEGPDFRTMENVKVAYCKVKVTLPSGRYEEATATLKMTSPADDLMKVETKAKRRATLSILGVGVLSEEEAESIPASERADARREQPRPQPSAVTLPRDNGPSPSQAAAAQPPAVDHFEAARALIDGAGTAEELAAARAVIGRDHLVHLGPTERTTITAMRDARAAALSAATPTPPDDPPPNGPRGRRKAAASTAPADATGAPVDAANDPQGAAAWQASEHTARAHVRGIDNVAHLEASARRHGAALGPRTWGVRVYAERLAAMEPANAASAEAIVAAWMARGPKATAATAQRRAA